MKILQSFPQLLITLSLVQAADKITKKTEKTGVKRQIGYGFEAVPGVTAIHAPLPEEYFAVGHPTAHGGVQPLGIIHNSPALDSTVGFTSQGFDALHSGFGIYAAPHAIIASPFVNYHDNTPKTIHQLDQGWKGIESGHGHGSINRGHQIAQSLATKPAVPLHESVFEVAPQYDFGKGKHTYNQNSLVPLHSGFGSTAGNKGFVSFPSVKAAVHTPHHGLSAHKGYSFSTLHAPQTHSVYSGHHGGHQYSQIPAHNYMNHNFHLPNNQNHLHSQNALHSSHKVHSGHTQGMVHGSVNHGHHLAKNPPLPTGHSGFGVNAAPGKGNLVDTKHFGHGIHGNAVHGLKKVTLSNNYQVPSGHDLASPGLSHVPSGPARLSSTEFATTHDSSRRASSTYNSDFKIPAAPSNFGSSEHSDSSSDAEHTNSHGGGQKATSFQSFIIHSYKPAGSAKKHEYDSPESDENYSGPNYNSVQSQSGESRF